jgi:Cu+-exporting ATPase
MTSATTGFNPQATLTRIELPVSGLPLKEHSTHLESTLRAVNGVDEVKVNATANRLEVQYDAQKVDVSKLVGAVKSIGFQVGSANVKIGIENLRCASCVKFIEDELKSTKGVLKATVNIATQEATVDYLPQNTTLAELNKAIETWGYKPRTALSDAPVDKQEEAHAREYSRLMKMFWFAAIISVPVLLFAYPRSVNGDHQMVMDTFRRGNVACAVLFRL